MRMLPRLCLVSTFLLLNIASATASERPPDTLAISQTAQRVVGKTITGSTDDDELTGTVGDDTINALAGSDELYGGKGSDTLNGHADGDGLDGEEGADSLFGGPGDDHLNSRDGEGPDRIDGGPGSDLAIIERDSSPARYILSIANSSGKQFLTDGSTVVGIEQLDFTGGSGADSITGGSLEDDLKGGGANDTLQGSGGDDDLDAGPGRNTLLGGPGDDKLNSVNDEAIGDQLDGGPGIDLLILKRKNLIASIKLNFSRPQSAQILADGTRVVNLERLDFRGGAGDDLIVGGPLPDQLDGGKGDDILNGGPGPDGMDGGLGDDVIFVDNEKDVVSEDVGEGTDEVRTTVGFVLPPNVEKLTLLGKADISGAGNGLSNTIIGNAGKNVLTGGLGADLMDAANDSSRDTFVFRSARDSGNGPLSADRVLNFHSATRAGDLVSDLLDFHLIDADPAPGDQAFRFVTSFRSPSPTEADGQIRVARTAKETTVEIDFNGDNVRDSLIRMIRVHELMRRDFTL